jgi:hypothetical protein
MLHLNTPWGGGHLCWNEGFLRCLSLTWWRQCQELSRSWSRKIHNFTFLFCHMLDFFNVEHVPTLWCYMRIQETNAKDIINHVHNKCTLKSIAHPYIQPGPHRKNVSTKSPHKNFNIGRNEQIPMFTPISRYCILIMIHYRFITNSINTWLC